MKVGVLGASGMLGTDLVAVLSEAGHEVSGPTRTEVDLTDATGLRRWIEDAQLEAVVNAAAYTQVDGAESEVEQARLLNHLAVEALAGVCREAGIHATQVSTDYVFGGPDLGRPWREDDAVQAHGVYARTKLAGERAFRDVLGDEGLVVRTQWLFGLGGRNFVEAIVEQLAPGARLRVVDDQRGRPTWTRDLARGIAWLLDGRERGVVHVANEGEASWYDFARAIVEGSGVSGVRVDPQRSSETDRPAPRPAYSVLDLEGFVRRTGRRLPPWNDALSAYLRLRREAPRGGAALA